MANRKISVEFVAEMGMWKKKFDQGTQDMNQFKGEAGKAREELGKFGQAASQASQEVARFTRDAAGRMRDAKGRFVSEMSAAGKASGEAFGKNAAAGIDKHLRKAAGNSGRAVKHPWGAFLAVGVAEAAPALEVIPPLLAAIGGGLAALPSLAVGAAAAIGSIKLGTIGFGTAVSDVFADAPTGGGGGGSGGIDRTAAAERRLAGAQREAREAQLDVTRARFEAARELRDMRIQLAGLRLDEEAAARAVTDARRDLAEAIAEEAVPQDDVVRATVRLQEAEANLRQVQRTRGHTAADIARAELEIQDAQRELAVAVARATVPDDRVGDAGLRLRQAKQSLTEIQVRVKDLAFDNAAAQKAGVEGSDRVQAALRRQEAAVEAIISAQEALASASARAGAAGVKALTAYDKLSPNAKKVVDEIKKLKPELVGLKNLTQDRIFAGVNEDVRALGKTWLPIARQQAVIFGDNWNTMIHKLTGVANSPAFVGGVTSALGAWDRFFDGVNVRIDDTGLTLSHLLTKSTPFVDRFNAKLFEGLDQFNAQVDEAANNGELEKFFSGAAFQAEALLDLAFGIVRLVAQLADYGASSDVLRRMADAVDRLADGGPEMDRLKAIFAALNEALVGMRELVHDVGGSLADTLADPDTREAVKLLFDALGILSGALAGVVDLFNIMPGPLQTGLLLLGGLYLAFRKLSAIAAPMGQAIDRASDRLRDHGRAGDIAARGLDRVGRTASIAGKAFIGIEVASAVVSGIFRSDLNPQIEAATLGLERFDKAGRLSGEAARIFGEDADQLGHAMGRLATDGFEETADRIAEGVPLLGDWFQTWDNSMTKSTELVGVFDKALAQMVNNGKTVEAEAALIAIANRYNISVQRAKEILPEYAAATEVAAKKTNELTGEITNTVGAYRAWRDMQLAAIDAEFAWMDAADEMKEKLEEIRVRGWDANTTSGRENIRMLIDNAQKAVELRDKRLLEGDAVEEVNKQYWGNLKLLRDNAIATGASTTAVDKYISKVHAVPPVKRTKIEVTIDAFAKISQWGFGGNWFGSFGSLLSGLQYQIGTLDLSKAKPRADGGIDYFMAGGGIVQAHIARDPTIMYGERKTRGEAYVPMDGDRSRALSILSEAAGWHGAEIVRRGQQEQTYSRPLSSVGGSWTGPTAAQIGDAVGDRVGPMVTAAIAAVGTLTPVAELSSEGLALTVRHGEQRLGRRG